MKPKLNAALASAAAAAMLSTTMNTHADEGMWRPDQLPELRKELRALGLKVNPKTLSELDQFPMNAVISLGGCTASFVSPEGLVVTNHHCAYGSIQYNSKEGANLLADGFLAKNKSDELQAAPGSRVYVTVGYDDVTDNVIGNLSDDMAPRARFQEIENREKAIVAACEEDAGHRCTVAAFHGGLEYFRIKQLEIKDIRLVYAPSEAIGKFGGDIDNWQWPRHTGDFAFYRAYVAADGSPAEYSANNIPFTPPSHLKIATTDLKDGDFVMAAGYPGRTSRYRRLSEVENQFDYIYPTWIKTLDTWIGTIESATANDEDAAIKYASLIASLNNFQKNSKGQIEGAQKVDLVGRRRTREADLDQWVASTPATKAKYARSIADLDALIEKNNASREQDFYRGMVGRSSMLSTARRLYRYAKEQAKSDTEREPGYQERDLPFIKQSLEALDRRFDREVDKTLWLEFLKMYVDNVPMDQRNTALDEALGLKETWDLETVKRKVDRLYAETKLIDGVARLSHLNEEATSLEASQDPFLKLAVSLYESDIENEEKQKSTAGALQTLRPKYMEAIIAFQEASGALTYPDANSTLRVTYGTVKGAEAQDGLAYTPFTTLRGITAKFTGEDPFDSPQSQLDKIAENDFGGYDMEDLNSVPVNFLTTLDSTGGNSGSPTLNGKGELVGLLFDGTYESINSDWDFDEISTRTIHVDTRYMLWIMEKVDGAEKLLKEMGIK